MNFPPTDPVNTGVQRSWTPRPLEPLCAPVQSHDNFADHSAVVYFRGNMPNLLTLTVMLGGPSAEREGSLRSGAQAAAALRRLGPTGPQTDPPPESWNLPQGTPVGFSPLAGPYWKAATPPR